MTHFSLIFMLLSTCVVLSVEGQGWNLRQNNRGFRGYYGDRAYEETTLAPKKKTPIATKPKTRAGLGLSAWGIVGIVLAVIFIAVGMYYMVLFYPILCKEERKYDPMELQVV